MLVFPRDELNDRRKTDTRSRKLSSAEKSRGVHVIEEETYKSITSTNLPDFGHHLPGGFGKITTSRRLDQKGAEEQSFKSVTTII